MKLLPSARERERERERRFSWQKTCFLSFLRHRRLLKKKTIVLLSGGGKVEWLDSLSSIYCIIVLFCIIVVLSGVEKVEGLD